MFSRLSTLPRSARVLLRLVLMRFREDRCLQVAGELTFTTLLALVPLLTIAFALFAAFPVFEDWSNAFKVFLLTTLVPEMGGKIITVYMQQFADNAAKLTVIGLVFLALTALALMLTIERVFNVSDRERTSCIQGRRCSRGAIVQRSAAGRSSRAVTTIDSAATRKIGDGEPRSTLLP